MFSLLMDWGRLIGGAWRLSRHDALLPHEFCDAYPLPLRIFADIIRTGSTKTLNGRPLRPGERLARAFEGMGPSYVKLGQFMATRPDIIGFTMADDLARLQDKMPPFARETATAEIERSFGKSFDSLFTDFSDSVAAASVAQVHRATTRDGKKVAVKVLRPEIEKKAQREFRAFSRLAKTLEWLMPAARRMEPVKFIATLKAAATVELDLRMEAGAASAMAESLASKEKTRAPDIIWPLSNKRVLTMEWVDGVRITDTAALEARGIDRKDLATKILRLFLTQALHEGFFHADLHQGNLLIDEHGQLVLIDFGIMGRLDEKARNTFAEIIYGFISRDYQRTAQVHFEAGYISPDQSVDAFAQALRAVGEPLYGHNADMVDMSKVLQQLFDVTDLFNMHLRPELILLQRTMVTVEGVTRSLDPQINMWEAATPIVKSYLDRELGPKAHLEKLRRAAIKSADILPRLPDMVDQFAKAAEQISTQAQSTSAHHQKLIDDTLARHERYLRYTAWFAGICGILLAIILIFDV